MVVIDPRLSATANAADRWLPIRSGTDMALVLAMINHISASRKESLWKAPEYMFTASIYREQLLGQVVGGAPGESDLNGHQRVVPLVGHGLEIARDSAVGFGVLRALAKINWPSMAAIPHSERDDSPTNGRFILARALAGAEAPGDFLLDLAHSQVAFGAIIGERDVGVLGEAQHGALVLFHSLPQIVSVGPGHAEDVGDVSRFQAADEQVGCLHGVVSVVHGGIHSARDWKRSAARACDGNRTSRAASIFTVEPCFLKWFPA